MTEENKNLVKEILSQTYVQTNSGASRSTPTTSNSILLPENWNIMEELDQKEANEILVRSSPVEVC